ncbi:hypothetical protein MAR_012518 [Mya arenaria]|uniref:Uncharacterized protein n=1 Tax=Mya arenaria TaxID=6604 RepID=A0ABY7G082_MYAAR|nr:hypothetical protein MAR_012518 [Mya arenaria]
MDKITSPANRALANVFLSWRGALRFILAAYLEVAWSNTRYGIGISVLARRTLIHLSSILRSCLVQYKIQDRSVMVIEAVRSELCTGKTF